MNVKSLALALVGSLVFLGVAHAQTVSAATQAKAATSTEVNQAVAAAAPKTGSVTITDDGSARLISASATVGWYYVHATNCQFDGTTFYLFPQEGGSWWSNISAHREVLAPACQTNNWVAFYVYDTSGAWNQIFTYAYK